MGSRKVSTWGWFAMQCVSSVLLTFLNKELGSHGNQFFILVVQMVGSSVVSVLAHATGLVEIMPLRLSHMRLMWWVAPLYAFMLFTSMRGLGISSMSLSTVGRNLTPLVTAIGETLFLGARFSGRTYLSFLVLLLAAVVYGYHDLSVSVEGVALLAINLALVATQALSEKTVLTAIEGQQTPAGVSLYRNLLALPLLALLSLAPELTARQPAPLASLLTVRFGALLLLSCLLSFTMGLSTFSLQKAVTSTTLTVANVGYKALGLLLSFAVFQVPFNSPLAGLALCISFAGAFWYVYERKRSSGSGSVASPTALAASSSAASSSLAPASHLSLSPSPAPSLRSSHQRDTEENA